jgi:TPR repeat protein
MFEDGVAAYQRGDYRKAAEQGHAEAQFKLGAMYFSGDCVPQDDAGAVKWYRMAAEQGHTEAQADLAYMYENGLGMPQDPEPATSARCTEYDKFSRLG